LIDNVQTLVDRERNYSRTVRQKARPFNVQAGPDTDPFFDDYRNFSDINKWVDPIAANYSELVVVTQLNTTYEGRPLRVVKITSGKQGIKPVIYWEGGIHAREWITHATMCYQISKLVTGYPTDAVTKTILDNFEVHIVPIVNGDGYVWTWTNDRNWRKTVLQMQEVHALALIRTAIGTIIGVRLVPVQMLAATVIVVFQPSLNEKFKQLRTIS